jgi:hypothetical protein
MIFEVWSTAGHCHHCPACHGDKEEGTVTEVVRTLLLQNRRFGPKYPERTDI